MQSDPFLKQPIAMPPGSTLRFHEEFLHFDAFQPEQLWYTSTKFTLNHLVSEVVQPIPVVVVVYTCVFFLGA